jgi:hypothetical protein
LALQMMMVAMGFQWPQIILWLPEQMYGAK